MKKWSHFCIYNTFWHFSKLSLSSFVFEERVSGLSWVILLETKKSSFLSKSAVWNICVIVELYKGKPYFFSYKPIFKLWKDKIPLQLQLLF